MRDPLQVAHNDSLTTSGQSTGWTRLGSRDFEAFYQVPGSITTDLVVRQLHRGQRRNEQFGDADHVVVTEHGDIAGDFQASAQQQLVGTEGNPVIAADQNVELRTAINHGPFENGGGFQ